MCNILYANIVNVVWNHCYPPNNNITSSADKLISSIDCSSFFHLVCVGVSVLVHNADIIHVQLSMECNLPTMRKEVLPWLQTCSCHPYWLCSIVSSDCSIIHFSQHSHYHHRHYYPDHFLQIPSLLQ